ncbi:MAG: hypothetical protein TRG1_1669 [Flavobacteriaceae bacterium FS1-H7996/R]|nr:MAG: hypothetical protein TRG1_1669 [Flavobacteriaceae bacterium FS1-H7996/R]
MRFPLEVRELNIKREKRKARVKSQDNREIQARKTLKLRNFAT